MPALTIAARVAVAVLLLIAVIASGWSGLLVTAGLVLLVLAVQLLVTRRARWAFVPGPIPRGYGVGALGAALLAFVIAGAASSPAPQVQTAPVPTVTETSTATVTKTTTSTATATETTTAPAVTITEGTAPAAAPAVTATAAPEPPPVAVATPTQAPAFWANCTEVRAAGKAPLSAGQPGYSSKLDRDDDGTACDL